ncbi:hypothetical protein ACIQZD_11060 [Peribacillus sp. NPDC096447]|uniref:hypothetical protein n=1 Tax=Peribacillus sp. NPDC096447 TaxID=3364394 RepID=UPI0037F2EC5E
MAVLAVSCALVALVAAVAAVAVIAVVDADAAEVAAVVAGVAPVKYPGFQKEVPACTGTFLYIIRHKRQIVIHRIKVKY